MAEHVLDGQQRLTAIWRGFHNNYDDRTYYLFLHEDEEPVGRSSLTKLVGG